MRRSVAIWMTRAFILLEFPIPSGPSTVDESSCQFSTAPVRAGRCGIAVGSPWDHCRNDRPLTTTSSNSGASRKRSFPRRKHPKCMAAPRRETVRLSDYQLRCNPGILARLFGGTSGRCVGVECPRCQRRLAPLEHFAPPTICDCGLSLQACGTGLHIWEGKKGCESGTFRSTRSGSLRRLGTWPGGL